jgi:hypothetical protein
MSGPELMAYGGGSRCVRECKLQRHLIETVKPLHAAESKPSPSKSFQDI